VLQSATTYPSVVGRVLAFHREQTGLSQADLAHVAGVTQSTWSKVERGESSLALEQLRLVAPAMKKRPGEIVDEAERAADALRESGVDVQPNRIDPNDAVAVGLAIVALAVVTAVVVKLLSE
jgi:transcriptional regulator with XRE-family HTH domain